MSVYGATTFVLIVAITSVSDSQPTSKPSMPLRDAWVVAPDANFQDLIGFLARSKRDINYYARALEAKPGVRRHIDEFILQTAYYASRADPDDSASRYCIRRVASLFDIGSRKAAVMEVKGFEASDSTIDSPGS